MAEQEDLQIRSTGQGAGGGIFAGLAFVGGGIFLAAFLPGEAKFFAAIPALIGICMLVYWSSVAADNSVKVTLAGQGLRDHRKERLIPWLAIRGARLMTTTTNNSPTAATLYLRPTNGEDEVQVNVFGLDQKPAQILNLVEDRILEARQVEAASPEAVIGAVLTGIAADLEAGIPLSFAIAKLVNGGWDGEAAAHMVALAAGPDRAECPRCRLQYQFTVRRCSGCSGELVPAATRAAHDR